MDLIDFDWTKTEAISIKESGMRCGFDLSTINFLGLSDERRNWIESEIINKILEDIDNTWKKDQQITCLTKVTPLSKVNKGVYVITLADNFCIKYERGYSQVVYIGKGQIRDKIKNYPKHWFLQFAKSKQEFRFNIWITEIKRQGSPNAFMDVEADLFEIFQKEHGGLPIQNSKGGNYHKKDHLYNSDWKTPLKVDPSINIGWCIKPMPDNEWFAEIEE